MTTKHTLDEAWKILETERKRNALKRAGWREVDELWEMPDNGTRIQSESVKPKLAINSHKYTSMTFRETLEAFIKHRGSKMTQTSLNRIISKLEKNCVSQRHAVFTLNQSIERGWSGVFPESSLKELEQQDRERQNHPTIEDKPKMEPVPQDLLQWAESQGLEVGSVKQLWKQDSIRKQYHASK